jgi:hypothetical protein
MSDFTVIAKVNLASSLLAAFLLALWGSVSTE